MMMLIDKTAAYKALKHEAETHVLSFTVEAYDRAARIIDQMPTIEAEPVRHGRWNYRHEDDWCYCTACGTDAEGSDGECLETDFCPHCGADMREVSEDATD